MTIISNKYKYTHCCAGAGKKQMHVLCIVHARVEQAHMRVAKGNNHVLMLCTYNYVFIVWERGAIFSANENEREKQQYVFWEQAWYNYERGSVNALGNTTIHVTATAYDHCLHNQNTFLFLWAMYVVKTPMLFTQLRLYNENTKNIYKLLVLI